MGKKRVSQTQSKCDKRMGAGARAPRTGADAPVHAMRVSESVVAAKKLNGTGSAASATKMTPTPAHLRQVEIKVGRADWEEDRVVTL